MGCGGDTGVEGQGVGRNLVEALLASPLLRFEERMYLMTTQSQGFCERLGFLNV